MTTPHATTCRRCKQAVTWVTNARNGHRTLIDPEPTPNGTAVASNTPRAWDGTPYFDFYPNPELAANTGLDRPRYLPHAATCPAPAGKRRRR